MHVPWIRGRVANQAHVGLPEGTVEEEYARDGFFGGYAHLYRKNPPVSWTRIEGPLRPRAYDTRRVGNAERVAILANAETQIDLATLVEPMPFFFRNADADELLFVHEGGGLLRSPLGDLRLEREDWAFVPRGLFHRIAPDAGPQRWLVIEANGVRLPSGWRNETGQLRMDAPLSERDFRRPTFRGLLDEGIRELVVKRGGVWHGFALEASPLDVVGWDGALYPFALPIRAFQPRVGQVHLPPTVHGTFAMKGALACSFVPRPLDFHPEAVPCPYPHASVDVDEVLFYSRGSFTSRRGVGPGSISLHPAGVMHGPHPGAYEGSIGARATDELAVMLDVQRPLALTPEAAGVEDAGYEASFST